MYKVINPNRYFINRTLSIGIFEGKILYIDEKGINKGICDKNIIQQQVSSIKGLELVQVSKNRDNIPIYKLLPKKQIKNIKYETEKIPPKTVSKIKELQISAHIADHDYQVKIKRIEEFIKKGYNVQLNIFSRESKNIEMNSNEIAQDVKTMYNKIIRDLNCAKEDTNSFHHSFSRIGTILKPK